MKLVVFSHKPCWKSPQSPTGYATDGGFPFQMKALSELFDETRIVVPCDDKGPRKGEIPLTGHNLSIVPLSHPPGRGWRRKIGLIFWFVRYGPVMLREVLWADAVHTPIPGDIGTLGMLLAWLLRKPLFVRHCGNWFAPRTMAEHFWKWFMERFAGGRNVMLATGGAPEPPSKRNPNVRWIFSTSMTERQLEEFAFPREANFGSSPKLIIAGRQEEAKGTGVVIQSLPLIQKTFPGVTLEVLGDGVDLPKFKELAKSLRLEKQVIFHGQVTHEEVLKHLRKADLFCFPSSSEGFPKVVLEALACGLPVVTTPVSVLPQLVNGCGVLLKERTPEALAEAVKFCLSDSERYREMSRTAIRTARQYSLERWRDTIGAVLQEAWGTLRSDEKP